MVRRYFPVDVGWLGRDGIYILTYCIDGCKEGVMDGFTSPSSSPPPHLSYHHLQSSLLLLFSNVLMEEERPFFFLLSFVL